MAEREEKTASLSSDVSQNNSDGANTAPPPPPIPNGGLIAWLEVVGSFCVYFTTWYLPFIRVS